MRHLEAAFQKQAALFLSKALPAGFFFTAITAGVHVGLITGVRLKAMGLKAGLPDMMIMAPGGWPIPIQWLELKSKSGRLSPEQEIMHGVLNDLGHVVAVVRSLEEVQEAIKIYVYPAMLKVRVTA